MGLRCKGCGRMWFGGDVISLCFIVTKSVLLNSVDSSAVLLDCSPACYSPYHYDDASYI